MSFLYLFDLFGTFVFAISGALLGVKKKMDIYGSFVLALAVAVGGGTVRDMMLGMHPFVLKDPNYLLCTIIAVLCVVFFNKRVENAAEYLLIADAIGLGVFTVIGASKALNAGLAWYAAVFLAVLTGTGGGMIRDVLARDIPFVLKKEVYASACIAGAAIFLVAIHFKMHETVTAIVTSSTVVFIRLYTYKKNINLPKVKKSDI